MRILILFFCLLSLGSCASYIKRQQCEKTNWFEYGEKVALEGRRLTGDQFILECQEADADVHDSDLDRGFKSGLEKYCLPDVVYQTGKNGNFFSTEMCTGQGLNLLKQRHKEGVIAYCQKSNGYYAGAKGEPYNRICPSELEGAFLPEFNKGRRKYLQTVVSENDRKISDLGREISRLRGDLQYKTGQLQGYERNLNMKDEKAAAAATELRNEISNLQYSVSSKERERKALEDKNSQLRLEMVRLEGP